MSTLAINLPSSPERTFFWLYNSVHLSLFPSLGALANNWNPRKAEDTMDGCNYTVGY